MSLLEKFEQVEIKADSRISPTDLNYCKLHQKAYENARISLASLAEQITKIRNEQEEILSSVEDQYCRDVYLGGSDSVKANDVYKALDRTHVSFICRIVGYFENNYKVSIECDKVEENLLPKKPENGWRRNEDEWIEYNNKLRALTLHYEDILEQIFIQLEGFSFQEKALNELKQAAHKAVWNEYHGIKKFEQKKATISFTSYACHVDSYYSSPHINLSDSMKDVIKAVAYFEYGTQEYLGYGFSQLCGYSFDCTVYEFDMDKVKQIKCFKNGRVDIKFTSEAYARQFVEEYLGTEV